MYEIEYIYQSSIVLEKKILSIRNSNYSLLSNFNNEFLNKIKKFLIIMSKFNTNKDDYILNKTDSLEISVRNNQKNVIDFFKQYLEIQYQVLKYDNKLCINMHNLFYFYLFDMKVFKNIIKSK